MKKINFEYKFVSLPANFMFPVPYFKKIFIASFVKSKNILITFLIISNGVQKKVIQINHYAIVIRNIATKIVLILFFDIDLKQTCKVFILYFNDEIYQFL